MTLACERCRQLASCSYTGAPTQIDLFNLMQLNETISTMQNQLRSIEEGIGSVHEDTQYIASEIRGKQTAAKRPRAADDADPALFGKQGAQNDAQTTMLLPGLKSNWALSLTPSGLRIDTDIVSFNDLYDILLSGLSHFQSRRGLQEDKESSKPSTTDGEAAYRAATPSSTFSIPPSSPLYKSKDIVFPLYSAWESSNNMSQSSSYLKLPSGELLDQLLKIYEECFLCLPLPDIDQFIHECKAQTCCPLVLNAMLSWSARHAAIYHGVFVGQDPNTVGEQYFETAKELLKDRFLTPSTRTVHALLLMYIYSIGKTGPDRAQAESEAYTFLGLATRMCLDLGLHDDDDDDENDGATPDEKKRPPRDSIEREKRRRLFAAAEFLETLCAAHSDKPVMFPTTDIAPEAMPHEQGERRYRTEFTVHRHKINQIYRRMHQSVCSKHDTKPLLFATVSGLEKQLKDWYAALPDYFHYRPEMCWSTGSFREQACLKLNFEYHFQMCQLYSIFLPPTNTQQRATSTIALLSLRLCVHGADAITDLLECWPQLGQPWCHFTLDTLVMACMIYSRLRHGDEENHAIKQLRRILAVLLRAPVRHHKYIRTLISRIRRQLNDNDTVEEEEHSNDAEDGEDEATNTAFAQAEQLSIPPQTPLNPSAALHPHPPPPPPPAPPAPAAEPSSVTPSVPQPNMPATDLHVQSCPNALSEEDWAWLKHPSVIDWAAHTDMDLFRFADFVYTPTMDPALQQPSASSSSSSEARLFHWH
ncbi:hypothetical protein BCR43DRAFT_474412 [Syncephalastrum racemosum]|uniref:Xylanolytic transcriptional activator regulatory domain-containing protein n=1 Tax=Syncephalastrum racemosum TaxID=13706 RepID=A0A1X2HCS7_SYNRA|nr:hypothetical protein BCR43DRAFT_474412 [Syncephalastrum racemosum]